MELMVNEGTPKQITNLAKKIRECLEQQKYTQTKHALQRQNERKIQLADAIYVLKNGYHEKNKTLFDEINNSWKYAIRGKTLEHEDIRIIHSVCR